MSENRLLIPTRFGGRRCSGSEPANDGEKANSGLRGTATGLMSDLACPIISPFRLCIAFGKIKNQDNLIFQFHFEGL